MIRLVSFGRKHPQPERRPDRIVDCTHLPNPHHEPRLRPLTGLDSAVQTYVARSRGYTRIAEHVVATVTDGDEVAFACYGGRHRSVAVAELVADRLRGKGFDVAIEHCDLRR
ncbi:RNase adapter RapZ [Sinorhizobium fredii]|uniref:RapZ C-terminal domain-containing protein n=1 Tax=Rhizobium fredii TaxID=380 RepID=UPI00309DF8D9